MTSVSTSVKRISLVADGFRARLLGPTAGVTILIYHRIGGGSGGAVDLDVAAFDNQLAHLAAEHRVVTLDEAVTLLGVAEGWAASASLDPPIRLDGAPVVITFDDGTADFVEHAVPALERHGLPATLYVATQFVDEQRDFPWGAPPATWAGLREAVSTGLITIGSHTHSHSLLDRLDPASLAEELDRSIGLIEDELGIRPAHFAYPKALPGSPDAEIAVRRRFDTAALATSRLNRPGHTDLHRLWRTPVQRTDDDVYFSAKARGGLRLEGELRSALARVRYRGVDR